MPRHLATLFTWPKVNIKLRAPWPRALLGAVGRVPIRIRPVNKCLHPDSGDGVEEVTRADTRRWPAGFGHAVAETAPAAGVAMIRT